MKKKYRSLTVDIVQHYLKADVCVCRKGASEVIYFSEIILELCKSLLGSNLQVRTTTQMKYKKYTNPCSSFKNDRVVALGVGMVC